MVVLEELDVPLEMMGLILRTVEGGTLENCPNCVGGYHILPAVAHIFAIFDWLLYLGNHNVIY